MLSWVSIPRNSLHYIVFGSKHIGVSDAQKQYSILCESHAIILGHTI